MGYLRRFSSLFLLVLLVACSTDEGNTGTLEDGDIPEPVATLTSKELEFLEEYEYVTFNLAPDSFGASVNEKWVTDVKVFLQGNLPNTYQTEVVNALEEFDNLTGENIGFSLVNSEEESNVHLIFGNKESIKDVWPDMYDYIGEVDFQGYALYKSANGFKIFDGRIWVRSPSIPLFKHELGHVLGLGHASTDYCERDFARNQSFMCSFLKEDFSAFDKAMVQTLYDPGVEAGKTFAELKPIIEGLLHLDAILVE